MNSGLVKVTPTTPTGATAARQRVYTVDQFSSQVYQPFTVEVGDPGGTARGQIAAGCSVNEWGFETGSEDTEVTMSGGLLGGKLVDDTMTTSGVTSSPFRTVLPSHLGTTGAGLFYASSFAGLESAPTQITSGFSVNFSMGDRRALYRFLGKSDMGPSGTIESDASLTFNITLADEVNPVDSWMANARAGTKQFFRVKFLGPIIEASIRYEFTLDICCVLADGPGREEVAGVLGRSFPYMAAYDQASGKILEFKIVNQTGA